MREKDSGYAIDAISSLRMIPIRVGARTLSDEEANAAGYRVERVVLQYRYTIHLDLWIFFVYFSWEGRIKTITDES